MEERNFLRPKICVIRRRSNFETTARPFAYPSDLLAADFLIDGLGEISTTTDEREERVYNMTGYSSTAACQRDSCRRTVCSNAARPANLFLVEFRPRQCSDSAILLDPPVIFPQARSRERCSTELHRSICMCVRQIGDDRRQNIRWDEIYMHKHTYVAAGNNKYLKKMCQHHRPATAVYCGQNFAVHRHSHDRVARRQDVPAILLGACLEGGGKGNPLPEAESVAFVRQTISVGDLRYVRLRAQGWMGKYALTCLVYKRGGEMYH